MSRRLSFRARVDEAGWLVRRFLWRNFFVVTLVWFVVVIVAVQGFALTAACTDDETGLRSAFGAVHWFVPDFDVGP